MKQLQKATIDEFKAHFRGDVLLPGDADYNDVRAIWNAMINRRPALIARCTRPEDVVQAVKFGRKQSLLVSIRGGGHNIAGNAICDDGLMIDLSPMKSVRVDAKARRATVEPGCTLADFDAAAQAHGLATPLGINSTTGVAGLTLGGGFGWITRKYGLTIDNLVAADVVSQVLGTRQALSADHLKYLDLLGNNSGGFDVGDFLAWVDATGAQAPEIAAALARLAPAAPTLEQGRTKP